MKALSLQSRILVVLLSTVAFLLTATLAWAVVFDYQSRGLVPNGVTLVGHSLAGMTEAQARTAMEEAVSAPMLRPVTVTAENKTWTLDPKGIVIVQFLARPDAR